MDLGHPCTRKSFEIAVRNGNVEIVEWLFLKINILKDVPSYCMAAAECGHLEVLKYLSKLKFSVWCNDACAKAAGGGHLDVLIWLNESNWGCNWYPSICKAAAGGGHLDVLMWLHKKGYSWDSSICVAAAELGHLPVLEWIYKNGCPLVTHLF
jgi:hypothetical protein